MVKLTTGILSIFILLTGLVNAEERRYHPKHLFIKMEEGQKLVKSELIQKSTKIIDNLYLVKTQNADLLESSLSGKQGIEYVQKDFFAGKRKMPKLERMEASEILFKNMMNLDFGAFNDPEVTRLWAFGSTQGLDVVGAYATLPNRTPEEIIVAVADTGVDHDHEDLKDVMWVNNQEIPGDGIDNDANGYIDDVHGINVLVRDTQGRATSNTMASHWHGTHVSGTIAATQNNGIGIAGVANNVKIMAIRVVPDDADELDSNIVEGFKYAAKMGAKLINCSFGKKNNEGGMVVRDVINEIGEKYGVLVVASAGNDSQGPFYYSNNDVSPKYPASYDSTNLFVIASTTSSGMLSSFSNIGPTTVDVASPGSNIYSTVNGSKYSMASGTSMAAPNATGVAAMVLGYFPELSVTKLKEVLISSAVKTPEFEGKMVSGGRINLKKALELAAKE
jgi:thermitase